MESMMSNLLKRCPFCGGEAQSFHLDKSKGEPENWPGTYIVKCINRSCGVMPQTHPRLTEGDAIAAWNKRMEER